MLVPWKEHLTGYLSLLLLPAALFLTGFGYAGPNVSPKADSSYEKRIYERFLNNEIAVMRQVQPLCDPDDVQPYYIRELFWDNDIEYCYFDIDGDGREELHIRDSGVYYAVKVRDQTLQILHEGWWISEPVRTDSLCGVLIHEIKQYTEFIGFITIDADGNKDSTGLYSWCDENRNGIIDETDTFSAPRFYAPDGIDKADYQRFQEKYTIPEEYQLPWLSMRIKNFAGWQDAYADFIHTLHVTGYLPYPEESRYSLVYLDADAIPELYVETGGVTINEIIVSFYNGKVQSINRYRAGMKYLEHQGLLYNDNGSISHDHDGDRGFYPCNVYRLSKGTFTKIGTGWYAYQEDEEGNLLSEEYCWEGRPVTKSVYGMRLRELIDTSRCVEPATLYKEKEITKILTQDSR